MSDTAGTRLHSTMDADVWAREFMMTWGSRLDKVDLDLMRGWFANAIMRGYDNAGHKLQARIAQLESELAALKKPLHTDGELTYLGDFSATPPERSISLSCYQCGVSWTGCQDACHCPRCGSSEDYTIKQRDNQIAQLESEREEHVKRIEKLEAVLERVDRRLYGLADYIDQIAEDWIEPRGDEDCEYALALQSSADIRQTQIEVREARKS